METNITVRLIDETRAGFSRIQQSLGSLDSQAKRTANSFKGLQTAALGFVTAIGVRGVTDFVNSIQTLDNRLKLVTNSQSELNTTFGDLLAVAQRTRAPIAETVELFTKLSLSAQNLGLSQREVLTVTENFNKTLALSGAGAQEAAAATLQFAQALASGALRGDEFRSLNENNPVLMSTLARQLQITRGELREYASKGLLTAEIITRALQEATQDLDQQFARTDTTISQATTKIANSFVDLGRKFDQATGLGGALASGLSTLADNLDIVLIALAPLAALLAGGLIVAIGGAIAAFSGISLAVAGVAAGVGVAAAAIYAFRDDVMSAFARAGKTIDAFFAGLAAAFRDPLNGIQKFNEAFDESIRITEEAEKAQDQYTSTARDAERQINRVEGATSDLTKTIRDDTKATDNSTDANKSAADMLRELQREKDKTNNQYQEFIRTLEEEIRTVGLDSREKEIQININRALAAEAKATGKTISDLSEQRRAEIAAEVRDLTNQVITEREAADARKKILEDLRRKQEEYDSFIKNSRQVGLNDLQRFLMEEAQAQEDYRNGQFRDEQQFRDYMQALRRNYQSTYEQEAEDFRRSQLSSIEQYQLAVQELTDRHNAGLITSEEQKNILLERERQRYFKKFDDEAQAQREREESATDTYHRRLRELQEAYQAGGIKSQQDYDAIRRSIEEQYRNTTVQEYSNLYGLLNEKLRGLTGMTQKEFGIMEETVRLVFGVSINDIIKQSFAAMIRYVIGFRQGTNGEMNTIGGIFNNIFGSSGQGTSAVGGFASAAGSILTGFGSTVSNIFSGIGGFIVDIFSNVSLGGIANFIKQGLSLFGSFGSNIMSVMGDVGSFILRNFSSLFDSVSSGASSLLNAVGGLFGGSKGGGGGGGVGSLISAGLNYITGGVSGIIEGIFSLFEKGGAFQSGRVMQRYFTGGIVTTPTLFPMANGMGLMGEAGAEAVLPLTRSTGGRLGVKATGIGGGGVVNVNFTINAMDGASVERVINDNRKMITNVVRGTMREGGIRDFGKGVYA